MIASLTTDIAIDIMRRTEEEFLSCFPNFSHHGDMLKFASRHLADVTGGRPDELRFEGTGGVPTDLILFGTLKDGADASKQAVYHRLTMKA